MALVSIFKLEIAGDPKQYGDSDKLTRAVSRSVNYVDPDHDFVHTTFARLRFRYTWSGVIRDINKIDNLHKLAMEKMKELVKNWEYSIKVVYNEKGDES